MSKLVNENTGAFATDLKTNPRLVYQKYRAEVISWASNRCNEITGPSGLLAWILTPAEWAAFPPLRTMVAGVLVIAPIFDILTPIEIPPNNATNAVMKLTLTPILLQPPSLTLTPILFCNYLFSKI